MRLNIFKTIIAIAICALLAYTISTFNECTNKWVIPLFGGLGGAIMLVCTLALDFNYLRTMANIKILSGIFFSISTIVNALYAVFGVSTSTVIITNGFLVLIHVLLVYGLATANKN